MRKLECQPFPASVVSWRSSSSYPCTVCSGTIPLSRVDSVPSSPPIVPSSTRPAADSRRSKFSVCEVAFRLEQCELWLVCRQNRRRFYGRPILEYHPRQLCATRFQTRNLPTNQRHDYSPRFFQSLFLYHSFASFFLSLSLSSLYQAQFSKFLSDTQTTRYIIYMYTYFRIV